MEVFYKTEIETRVTNTHFCSREIISFITKLVDFPSPIKDSKAEHNVYFSLLVSISWQTDSWECNVLNLLVIFLEILDCNDVLVLHCLTFLTHLVQ